MTPNELAQGRLEAEGRREPRSVASRAAPRVAGKRALLIVDAPASFTDDIIHLGSVPDWREGGLEGGVYGQDRSPSPLASRSLNEYLAAFSTCRNCLFRAFLLVFNDNYEISGS